MCSPNAPSPALVAIQTRASVEIHNDTPSHLSKDTTDPAILTQEYDIVIAFPQLNNNAPLRVDVHHSSLHSLVSTFDTGAGPNSVDRSFLRPSLRKHSIPVVKLRLKSTLNQGIHIRGTIKLVNLHCDLYPCLTFWAVYNIVVPVLLVYPTLTDSSSKYFLLKNILYPFSQVHSPVLHSTITTRRQIPWLWTMPKRTKTTNDRKTSKHPNQPRTGEYQNERHDIVLYRRLVNHQFVLQRPLLFSSLLINTSTLQIAVLHLSASPRVRNSNKFVLRPNQDLIPSTDSKPETDVCCKRILSPGQPFCLYNTTAPQKAKGGDIRGWFSSEHLKNHQFQKYGQRKRDIQALNRENRTNRATQKLEICWHKETGVLLNKRDRV